MKKIVLIHLVASLSLVGLTQHDAAWWTRAADSLRVMPFILDSSEMDIEREVKQLDGKTLLIKTHIEFDFGSIDTAYFRNGLIKSVEWFFDGLGARSMRFDTNGKLIWIEERNDGFQNHGYDISFHDGVLIGYKIWEDGDLREKGDFIDGKLQSQITYSPEGDYHTTKEFFSNGVLKMQASYIGKRMDGTCLMNFETGRPKAVMEFDGGQLFRVMTYNPDGSPVSAIEEYQEKEHFQYCNDTGDVCCDCIVKDGKLKCKPVKG